MSRLPYPGLRPYRRDEVDIYFGREGQIDDQLVKLERHRFLAVVGPSGCGKSSLVRTGLLDALCTGFMTRAGTRWRVADLRPGDGPTWQLASALAVALSPGEGSLQEPTHEDVRRIADVHARLSHGVRGLQQLVAEADLAAGTNLLLLVDQFEEIFRFRNVEDRGISREDARDESAEFVGLLLATARQSEARIYVLLTMRTGFIEQCFAFDGLPAAINESQFLVPLLTPPQLRRAIIGPAKVCGGEVEADLVERLLSDVGPEVDVLPLLQHALMRTWAEARERAKGSQVRMTLADYEKTGGLRRALSDHADEALEELLEEHPETEPLAETLFRELTDPGAVGQDTRRPRRVREVAEVAGLSADDDWRRLIPVIDAFRDPECSFVIARTRLDVTGAVTDEIHPDTVLDISHESLIRQWQRLKTWVKKEARQAQLYGDLARAAADREAGRADYLDPLQARSFRKWWDTSKPSPEWAKRYPGDFEQAVGFEQARDFLVASEQKHQWAQRRKELLVIGTFVLSVAIVFALAYFRQQAQVARVLQTEASQRALLVEAERQLESNRPRALRLGVEALGALRNARPRQFFAEALAGTLVESQYSVSSPAQTGPGAVLELAIDADGERLATNTTGGSVRLWDLEKRKPLGTLPADFQARPESLAFLPWKKDHLITGSAGGDLVLWHLDDIGSGGEPRGIVSGGWSGAPLGITRFELSPDGGTLAAGSADGIVSLWDVRGGLRERRRLEGHEGRVQALAFGRGEDLLASGGRDGKVVLWDVAREEATGSFDDTHAGGVNGLAWHPDRWMVATAGNDGRIILWMLEDGGRRPELDAGGEPERQVLAGHLDRVTAVAFSPDGRTLASASDDDVVILWRLTEGLERGLVVDPRGRQLHGHLEDVESLAFDHAGDRLFTGSTDGSVIVWDLVSGAVPAPVGPPLAAHAGSGVSVAFDPGSSDAAVLSRSLSTTLEKLDRSRPYRLEARSYGLDGLAFSPDGSTLAAAERDRKIALWDVGSRRKVGELTGGHDDVVQTVAFSPDGGRLVSGGDDGKLVVWDLESGEVETTVDLSGRFGRLFRLVFGPDGEQVAVGAWNSAFLVDVTKDFEAAALEGQFGFVYAVAFSADGRIFVTGDSEAGIVRWNALDGSPLGGALEADGLVASLAISPDGKTLVSGGEAGRVLFWDLETGERDGPPLSAGSGVVAGVAFSPDGKILATVHTEGDLQLWDVDSREPLVPPQSGLGTLWDVGFSPAGEALAALARDRAVSLWDADKLSQLVSGAGEADLEAFPPPYLAVSRDGDLLAAEGDDHAVIVHRVRATPPRPIRLPGHGSPVTCTVFGPHGRQLATGARDGTAIVWDLQDGAAKRRFDTHLGAVSTLAFSADGQRLATGSSDHLVRLWNLETGQAEGVLKGHRSTVSALAFNAAGNRLASGSWDNTVHLWNLKNQPVTSRLLSGHQRSVTSVAFSGDGKLLASGSYDETIQLWDTQTGEKAGTLTGHEDAVWSLDVSDDGRRLISADLANRVLLWDIDVDSWIEKACADAADPLTANELADFGLGDADLPDMCEELR